MSIITVTKEVYSTQYSIRQALTKLATHSLLSYDCETQSIYTQDEIAEAVELLKDESQLSTEDRILCKLVANSSGLSHPKITKVTHFIFGTSKSHSMILIAYTEIVRNLIFDWIINYTGKLLIHNTGFDLKIVHHHTSKFPIDFEDTQLLAKTFMNHTETWKANTGLKELMGKHYDYRWQLIEDYDNPDYKDPEFLNYCAIDGAATFLLWEQLQEHKQELLNESNT